MSTFDGFVSEFPDIRIDFFRNHPDRPPPLACFLSHIHSDHLQGLDNLRSPFVYCSAATREILLRLERYFCRVHYARGILEARQQTYKHLQSILKPLPLEAPTVLELQHGRSIQVTLFDANHCPGSVMFLIEGQGKAILYTGDVRAEPWFVTSIARNPGILEYTHGLKVLDKMYLDTSFVENIPFQTKSEGIASLLSQVHKYPSNTIFHLHTWTFGYENVWIALSKALNSRVHVDDYKLRIFNSLKKKRSDETFAPDFHLTTSSAALVGYICGNKQHPGCLTSDQNVRIHSCEEANMCSIAKDSRVVHIRPTVCRLPGGENIMEAGVGGGGRDFAREAQLPKLADMIESLPESETLHSQTKSDLTSELAILVSNAQDLKLDIREFSDDLSADIYTLLNTLHQKLQNKAEGELPSDDPLDGLPKTIFFPFARHSPYQELYDLANVFKPKDIWPCTVDQRWIEKGLTIKSLFGSCCSEQVFEHDNKMASRYECQKNLACKQVTPDTESQQSIETYKSIEITPRAPRPRGQQPPLMPKSGKRSYEEADDQGEHCHGSRDYQTSDVSKEVASSPSHTLFRQEAYQSMLGVDTGVDAWPAISLLCADGHHHEIEKEL